MIGLPCLRLCILRSHLLPMNIAFYISIFLPNRPLNTLGELRPNPKVKLIAEADVSPVNRVRPFLQLLFTPIDTRVGELLWKLGFLFANRIYEPFFAFKRVADTLSTYISKARGIMMLSCGISTPASVTTSCHGSPFA